MAAGVVGVATGMAGWTGKGARAQASWVGERGGKKEEDSQSS